MFQLYGRIKWLYQTFHLSYWLPFLALVSYTVIGAFIFQALERDRDQKQREDYRNRTAFAMDQVLDRMLEVRCHDILLKADRVAQIHHAKEALYWFLDHLNLTQVIEERTDDTPWTWLGSMFYAGQLYTTIGYGYPTTQTTGGRVASIFYILFGIPIFLIILKDMGQLLSKSLRKLYKRMGASKRKIVEVVEVTPLRRLSLHGKNHLKHENSALTESSKEVSKEKEELSTDFEKAALEKKQNHYQQNSFPISIALSILLLWIIFSASLFCIWEQQWGFMTSVYFFFVSISTVGLGDIVFSNPDMMIFNFILILIGLALLSMCFNLIQLMSFPKSADTSSSALLFNVARYLTIFDGKERKRFMSEQKRTADSEGTNASLERLLDRLLEEYIEEIEKMAEIVANDECLEEEAIPLEFKMTGNLLTLPMKKVQHEHSLLAEAKGWMAGRIAENLLASRLGTVSDSDSDDEDDVQRQSEAHSQTVADCNIENGPPTSHPNSSRRESGEARRKSSAKLPLNMARYRFHRSRPLFNTIKTLDRIKQQPGDFRGMIFSKFIQSDRLNKLVDDTSSKAPVMVTTSCQTDLLTTDNSYSDLERIRKGRRWRNTRKDSNSSFSTVYTNSMIIDDESLLSAAYCDLKFDYSTEVTSPPLNKRSTLSILKVEDDEPMLPSLLKNNVTAFRTPPTQRLQSVKESHSPKPLSAYYEDVDRVDLPVRSPSDSNLALSLSLHKDVNPQEENLEKICGLLPKDFDNRSCSSRSSCMVDSGYEKSVMEPKPSIKMGDSIREENGDPAEVV